MLLVMLVKVVGVKRIDELQMVLRGIPPNIPHQSFSDHSSVHAGLREEEEIQKYAGRNPKRCRWASGRYIVIRPNIGVPPLIPHPSHRPDPGISLPLPRHICTPPFIFTCSKYGSLVIENRNVKKVFVLCL